eukprot:12917094-Prorocentrum_lima.AAC.1
MGRRATIIPSRAVTRAVTMSEGMMMQAIVKGRHASLEVVERSTSLPPRACPTSQRNISPRVAWPRQHPVVAR